MSVGHRPDAADPAAPRRLPPVAELAVVSIALMLAGGIDLAAYIPRHPPLAVPVAAVAAGAVLAAADLVLLSRIRPFAWDRFFSVLRWALLAYAVIAGMIEYVFLYDHTEGAVLAVMTVALVVFAVDVPTILAFTVARFEDPGGPGGAGQLGATSR